jgi:uncharacterized protein (TIGR03067 family)
MRQGIALILAAGVLVTGPASGESAPIEDPAKKELQLLAGTWVIAGRELMGKQASKDEVEKLTAEIVIKDGKWTLWSDDTGTGKKEIVSEATLKLDAKAKPKTLDLTYTSGELKGTTDKVIYEVTGDTLKVCYPLEDSERPTEFAGKADGKAFLLTYKRVKK